MCGQLKSIFNKPYIYIWFILV